MADNEFKVFIAWIRKYEFVSKDINKDYPLETEVKLQDKKSQKVLELDFSNSEAVLFLRIWSLIQDERDH